jgi:hypothetical protein
MDVFQWLTSNALPLSDWALAAAAAFSAACAVYASFAFAGKHFNDETTAGFKQIVENGELRFHYMGELFDGVFTAKRFSWRFFTRSCLASFLWLVIITAGVVGATPTQSHCHCDYATTEVL